MENRNAQDIIRNIRKHLLHMTHYSKSSHIGSCLSICEILYTLYFEVINVKPDDPKFINRDKVILSKGHASAALYATLAERGFFPKDYLDRFYIDGGILPGHLDMDAVPGIEASSGSLGHGLSIGVGMAIANRIQDNPGKIYVILGDGECNEGSVWEAIMLASTLKLSNITAIVDSNRLQGFGSSNEIINQNNLSERFRSFGWETYEVNGHNVNSLQSTLSLSHNGPQAVIAHTIKGYGISFMENKLEWHYKSPNKEQYEKAILELEGRI